MPIENKNMAIYILSYLYKSKYNLITANKLEPGVVEQEILDGLEKTIIKIRKEMGLPENDSIHN